MLFARLADTSVKLAATRGRIKKVQLLVELIEQLAPEERAIAARFMSGIVPQKIGVGYATVGALHVPPAGEPSVTIREVDATFTQLAGMAGAGSVTARKEVVGALFARCTQPEQALLAALIVGELRQGANDALVIEAIARLTQLPLVEVRTAYMFAGDVGVACEAALAEGLPGLRRFGLQLFRPILPMLAQTADDAEEALSEIAGPMSMELKLDGFRVQVHKDGEDVRAYSRGLNDVSNQVPELLAAVRALPARRLVLDGEAIALFPDGRPRPFQDTMRRFGRTAVSAIDMPLSLAAFDALLVDDDTLITRPARERFAALAEHAGAHAVTRVITSDAAEAAAYFADAVAHGHEGVMAKALDAPYDAGNRGAAWLKLKKILRMDFVVIAAEWGSGRRKGWLSNLWLAARDGEGWSMLTKTFKGMTDEVLAWQTAALLAREIDRDGHVVHVRPELVVETLFNDVQRSPVYPSGMTLRHARIVRYRDDKTAAEADTIDAVRAIAVTAGVVEP